MPRLAYIYTSKKVATQNYSRTIFLPKPPLDPNCEIPCKSATGKCLAIFLGGFISCKRLKMQFRYEKRPLANLNLLKELIRETGKTIEVQKLAFGAKN